MQSSGWAFLAAVLFLGIGIYMLLTASHEWWSILSILVVFAGSVTFFARGALEYKRAKSLSSDRSDASRL